MINRLTIIIPAYNESAYITRCLENVINAKTPNIEKEIIVVNDGSKDNTLDILELFQKSHFINVISHERNMGKGACIKTALCQSTGEIVIVQDADLEYDPNDYVAILDMFNDSNVDVVYGSRITGAKIYHNYSANAVFYLGGITLTKITNVFFKTKLTDQPTGYKSWRRELSQGIIENCHADGFEFEIELTAYFSNKTEIQEVPIHYYPRTVSHGKKINALDFFRSVATIIRCWRKR